MKGYLWVFFTGVAFLAGMVLGSESLFAQGGGGTQSVSFEPLISFDGIFESLKNMIVPVVGGAIGIGLAVWGCTYMFGLIKRMAR